MDNTILMIFLIAAVNTLIVIVIVSLIMRLKIKKENKEIEDSGDGNHINEQATEKTVTPEKENKLQEEIIKPEAEEKEAEAVIEVAEKSKPKFLKYTEDGYVVPEEDKADKIKWR